MENILNFDDVFEEAFNFGDNDDINWDMSNFLEESIEEDSYTMEEFLEDVSVTSYICSDYIEESVSDVLGGIISKVRAFFTKLVEKFSNFIHKKAIKTKIENAKKMVVKSGIGKKKTTTIDYKKLSKLQQSTIDALGKCKSGDDVDRVMEEYSRRRKALLAKTAAVTVSVMALLTGAAVLIKNHSKGIGSLLKKGEGSLKKAFEAISSKFPKKEKAVDGEGKKKDNLLKRLMTRIASSINKVGNDSTADSVKVLNDVNAVVGNAPQPFDDEEMTDLYLQSSRPGKKPDAFKTMKAAKAIRGSSGTNDDIPDIGVGEYLDYNDRRDF